MSALCWDITALASPAAAVDQSVFGIVRMWTESQGVYICVLQRQVRKIDSAIMWVGPKWTLSIFALITRDPELGSPRPLYGRQWERLYPRIIYITEIHNERSSCLSKFVGWVLLLANCILSASCMPHCSTLMNGWCGVPLKRRVPSTKLHDEEWCLLGCYAVWLL
jgi:hypothetical protein